MNYVKEYRRNVRSFIQEFRTYARSIGCEVGPKATAKCYGVKYNKEQSQKLDAWWSKYRASVEP